MNDKQEEILFIIDCLNGHKYNFDYNLEELIKEAKKLQSNWNSLREWLEVNDRYSQGYFKQVLEYMNELEGKDKE